MLVQHFIQRLLREQVRFLFRQNRKLRIYLKVIEVLTNEAEAKTVQRPDMGLLEQS
jgi:hypothetical protein